MQLSVPIAAQLRGGLHFYAFKHLDNLCSVGLATQSLRAYVYNGLIMSNKCCRHLLLMALQSFCPLDGSTHECNCMATVTGLIIFSLVVFFLIKYEFGIKRGKRRRVIGSNWRGILVVNLIKTHYARVYNFQTVIKRKACNSSKARLPTKLKMS